MSQKYLRWTGTVWQGRNFPHPPRLALGPPSLIYTEYQVILGGKAARARCWPPTPITDDVKEREELCLYSPTWPSWPVLRWTLFRPVKQLITKCTTDFSGVQGNTGTHHILYLTGIIVMIQSSKNMKQTNHYYVVLTSRMCGALVLLPSYTFMM